MKELKKMKCFGRSIARVVVKSNFNLIDYTLLTLLIGFSLVSCESAYEPDTSKYPVEYVVEGFIELANEDIPTFVFLSRTFPFYDRIDIQTINDGFVRNAIVKVTTDGNHSVILTEICLNEIDPAIADLIREGLVVNGVFDNLCIYLDAGNEIIKKPGSQYDLDITIGNDHLTASTTIPDTVPVNRLFHEKPAGNPPESLFEFGVEFTDPINQVNFYRLLTGVNSLPLYSNNASVFDDVFFNGQTFSFPIPRPVYPGEDVVLDSIGFFNAGDTVHLKWTTLDKDHYEFWSSLEFDSNNGGPFASYTRASSNIVGGLGIWGGYASYYYDYIIPR
jgi:hypothetical protein